MVGSPEKFSTTRKSFGGFNNSFISVGSNVKVTDILIRGGGGTITFSDGVTVEYVFGFRPDPDIPSGGLFDITLQGPRAQLVYENIVSQSVCDMVDWILQCSDLARRVSILELNSGIGKEFEFTEVDWASGITNQIHIPDTGSLDPGEIGPHEFGANRTYHLSVWQDDGTPVVFGVDVELSVNLSTGLIKLIKAPLAPNFDGRVIIS